MGILIHKHYTSAFSIFTCIGPVCYCTLYIFIVLSYSGGNGQVCQGVKCKVCQGMKCKALSPDTALYKNVPLHLRPMNYTSSSYDVGPMFKVSWA